MKIDMGTVVNLDYADVRDTYLQILETQGNVNGAYYRPNWVTNRADWYGATAGSMREWIANGYRSEAIGVDGDYALKSVRRRRVWDDFDGEPDLDRLLEGDEFPFRTSRKVKESRSGLTLNVRASFLAGTDSATVAGYYSFVLTVIAGLEAHGHDLEVFICYPGTNRALNDRRVITPRVCVKKFGELSDYTTWSALFSPGGWRHLGFTACAMAVTKIGKTPAHDVGNSVSPTNSWAVAYDAAEGNITFDSPTHPYSFPADEMRAQMKEQGINSN